MKNQIIFENTQRMDVDYDLPSSPRQPLSTHRAFESEINPKIEKMRLCVSAAMTMILIYFLLMNWKWVKAQELPSAEQH
jgi:hypothetical protein